MTFYVGFVVVLMFLEPSLVFPAPDPQIGIWNADRFGATEQWVPSADGTKIHTWVLAHPNPRAVLIYCHGNAETLGTLGQELSAMRDRWKANVVAYDYRGYGKTGGIPKEKLILADAQAVGRWVRDHRPFASLPRIAFGRSLGGASAVEMAADGSADGLLLDRTFSSTVDVAAERYFLVPVRWIMQNQFKSIDRIGQFQGPLLQIHGDVDEVVPYRFGRRLHDASRSKPKEFATIPGLFHNDPLPDAMWDKAHGFIGTISRVQK